MKTVVVVGANGFVGHACSKHFSNNGYKVISLIRPNSSQTRFLETLDHLIGLNKERNAEISSLERFQAFMDNKHHRQTFSIQ